MLISDTRTLLVGRGDSLSDSSSDSDSNWSTALRAIPLEFGEKDLNNDNVNPGTGCGWELDATPQVFNEIQICTIFAHLSLI